MDTKVINSKSWIIISDLFLILLIDSFECFNRWSMKNILDSVANSA